jgi:sugar lactone lactonase YvrE
MAIGIMQKLKASLVVKANAVLGEGSLWHPIQQVLYWVDIEKMEVHSLEPCTNMHKVWLFGKRVSALVPSVNGNIIMALQGEIAELDITSGTIKTLARLESHLPQNRCNDGKCDAAGRFWIGTMHVDCKVGAGSLYCIDSHLNITKVLQNLTIANGMGWSPAGDVMYFIDSEDRKVRSFDFSTDKAELDNEKTVVSFDNKAEMPDGMCVDNEGMLWIAFWGGSRVGRYDPLTGEALSEIEVPAPHVTSCCFGGEDLTTLYITTARQGLSEDQLERHPLSGSIFSCIPGAKGSHADFFDVNT